MQPVGVTKTYSVRCLTDVEHPGEHRREPDAVRLGPLDRVSLVASSLPERPERYHRVSCSPEGAEDSTIGTR